MDEATARSLGRAADVVARRADDTAAAERLGLGLSRLRTVPGGLAYQRYTPSLSVVLAGRKRSVVGDDDQVWGLDRFFITPVDLPVLSGVVATDERYGFLSARWRLDPALVTEVATAMPRTRREPSGRLDRLGAWTPALADAFARLLGLLDEPEHIPLLGPQFARETVLRLLQTTQAPRVLAATDAHDPVVPRAVRLLTERIAEPWTLDALAAEVSASRATLSRRFKQATSMTPMQYLKRLRLGEARHRMVVRGDSAARAATAVGYRSAPHFTRDYRLVYGTSPAADAARAREQLREWAG
ncbi:MULTISPECIES: AraC family transcriptional regulator [unclassified Streptomyces]|uniref:AraC family transcriptional regulator n=1 Tax=unclassified Streptomyces TaxID=2593676 RepID=UPI00081ED05A|nr:MULTISPECIES: AraC family transcriptional regulator [unclassified Streptomyces]MYR27660.1 helix-turn-helix domain-containing protein [Streptomyces sp. SID4945]SCF26992.1 Helix-turn-helix domain-containing protein [Streptomyces sp. LcepLS]